MFGRQNDNWAWDAKQVGDFLKLTDIFWAYKTEKSSFLLFKTQ